MPLILAYFLPILAVVPILILLRKFLIFQPTFNTSENRQHGSPSAITSFLGNKTSSTKELLQSRALANQRLLRAFHLTNTFVSPEISVHDAFVRRIKDLTREQSRSNLGEWASFLRIARQAVVSELNSNSYSDYRTKISFADFVQIVTLKTIIVGLLDPDRDMDTLDPEDLRASAILIMKLWTSSKNVSDPRPSVYGSPDPYQYDLTKLNNHLRHLLPDTEKYPNPVDFVIPTWETLWRLIATSLARVYDNEEYCQVFQELSEIPTSQRFHGHDTDRDSTNNRLCADFIMNESLRLHSPSKHISRSFPVEVPSILIPIPMPIPEFSFIAGWPVLQFTLHWKYLTCGTRTQIQTEVADIENAHLSSDIWGPNALSFEPRRWAPRVPSHTEKEAPTIFAFGHGPLVCVGKKWAPIAAAMIVAAILEGVKSDGREIVGKGCIGGRTGWDAWSIE